MSARLLDIVAVLLLAVPLLLGSLATGATPDAVVVPSSTLPTPSHLLEQGLAASAQGRHHDALLAWQQALVLAPHWPASHNNVGTALMALGRPLEARGHFLRASQLSPTEALFRNNLAWAERELSRAGVSAGQAF
jgi:Flp pilus assembly protein TadD